VIRQLHTNHREDPLEATRVVDAGRMQHDANNPTAGQETGETTLDEAYKRITADIAQQIAERNNPAFSVDLHKPPVTVIGADSGLSRLPSRSALFER